MGRLLLAYALLLVYGSWYPFTWAAPEEPLFTFLHTWPAHLDKGDVIQNVLVYMPFGLLMAAWRGGRRHIAASLLLVALCGTAISLGVEVGQQYLPARVPSLVDVAMNLLGSVVGGLLGILVNPHTAAGAQLHRLRDAWFRPGPLVNAGLVVIGLWFLSHTSPLVPSLDIAHLRGTVGYLVRSVLAAGDADLAKLAASWCYQAGVGVLLCSLVQPRRPLLRLYVLLAGAACAAKLLVVGRVLSLELVAATALALPVLALVRDLPLRALAFTGIALLASGLAIYELAPGDTVPLYPPGFNWIPFEGQMNDLSGLENILEFLWPPMAMACLLRSALPFHRQEAGAVLGGIAIALGLFLLEWLQQSVPGRYGDITQVLLACGGWIAPWCVRQRVRKRAPLAA